MQLVEQLAQAFASGDAAGTALRCSECLVENIAFMTTAMQELTNRQLHP